MRKYNVFVIDNKEIEKLCGEKLELSDGGFYSNACKGPDYWSEIEAHVGMPIVSIRPSGREGWDEFLVVCANGYMKDGVPCIKGSFDYIQTCLYDIFMEAENDECEVFDCYTFDTSKEDYQELIDWMVEEWDYEPECSVPVSDPVLDDAIKIALDKGLFEIVKVDGISEYGCMGIVCQVNGINKGQFYFGEKKALAFEGTAEEYVNWVGKRGVCQNIASAIDGLIEDGFADEAHGYLADLRFCLLRYNKNEFVDIVDEYIEKTNKYIDAELDTNEER